MPISVIIPSFKNPTYLDLCLRSAFENQKHENQIIVVLDGHVEQSAEVIKKYPDLNVVEFEENKGQMVAHNTGVYFAENEYVLLVNDDNVFPPEWDVDLRIVQDEQCVIAPNQIEPAPSIFKSFVIENFGTTPENFQYDSFMQFAKVESSEHHALDTLLRDDGQTWPLFMAKKWYMALGGVDTTFPSAAVADHDFFLRCELAGLSCKRFMGCHFYHFASAATRKKDNNWNEGEMQSHQYFEWKWGFLSQFFPNNSHLPRGHTVKGVKFE